MKHSSRRDFLKAAGTAAAVTAWSARSYSQIQGAHSRLGVAIIGCGNMGGAHLRTLLGQRESENIALRAVCDVWLTRANRFRDQAREAGADPVATQDYRDVLAMKDVDYVVLPLPNHWHAPMTLEALEAGKHVYVEKPMTHTIREAHQVVAKAAETGLRVQTGVQAMSDDSYSSAWDAIKGGALGPIVHAQTDYVRWYPADQGLWRTGEPAEQYQPEDLDWAMWQKHNPKQVPYDPRIYFDWRCYKDYSGGISTDLFIHRLTRIIKACNLACPVRAVGMGGIFMWPDGRTLPDNFELILEYPAQAGVTPGMTVHVLGTMANKHGIEHCIRGHKATLLFTDDGWRIVEQESGAEVLTHKKTGAEDIDLHHKNLQAAIRENVALNTPPELGMYGVVACTMANISYFEKAMVAYDAKRGKVKKA